MDVAVWGLGSVALFGVIAIVASQFVGGGFKGLLGKLTGRGKEPSGPSRDEFIQEKLKKIETIRSEQARVVVEIEESEEVATEVKEVIKKKVAKTNKEINAVLVKAKEDPSSLPALVDQLNEEW